MSTLSDLPASTDFLSVSLGFSHDRSESAALTPSSMKLLRSSGTSGKVMVWDADMDAGVEQRLNSKVVEIGIEGILIGPHRSTPSPNKVALHVTDAWASELDEHSHSDGMAALMMEQKSDAGLGLGDGVGPGEGVGDGLGAAPQSDAAVQ